MSYLATAAPVPYWLYGQQQMGGPFSDLSAAETSPTGSPEPPALPFLLSPMPPPPPGYPLLPPPPPIVIQLDPGFLADVDSRRSSSLVQFLEDEGAVPTAEDDKKREKVIRELKKIVTRWVKEVAYEQSVPPRIVTATVLTYGSYTLGYHFFVVLRQILEGRPEVSEVQTVESAKVPLMRFRFDGIAVDFTYAQLPAIDAAKAIDTRSWRSLSGVRVNERIVQLVPDAERPRLVYHPPATPPWMERAVRTFAPAMLHMHFSSPAIIKTVAMLGETPLKTQSLRCLHSVHAPRAMIELSPFRNSPVTKFEIRLHQSLKPYLGFFAGIHLAILAAYVCQRYPNASVNGLFTMFFQTFAHWSWQVPLEKIGIGCDPCPLEEMDHTVIKPNIVYYWGLITQTVVPLDAYSLGEDFMNGIITDIYGKVKCTHSELTVSLVGLPELPKSMCSHSVYLQYMPYCVLGYPYQTATEDQKAIS
ncbi:hypothetical protein PR202_ga28747 [Eleusine coracana subsp. coracana]|uniref:polynucleotide adenylyltransferase n=1 Tax=Eleusine coracana subsp. coracana TaxID=191504 RepID=A0AAV5DJM6_ELECO|nr:hypothetical protein PR202_ga28747 [Eleusine coracana subsp. coracana]